MQPEVKDTIKWDPIMQRTDIFRHRLKTWFSCKTLTPSTSPHAKSDVNHDRAKIQSRSRQSRERGEKKILKCSDCFTFNENCTISDKSWRFYQSVQTNRHWSMHWVLGIKYEGKKTNFPETIIWALALLALFMSLIVKVWQTDGKDGMGVQWFCL